MAERVFEALRSVGMRWVSLIGYRVAIGILVVHLLPSIASLRITVRSYRLLCSLLIVVRRRRSVVVLTKVSVEGLQYLLTLS